MPQLNNNVSNKRNYTEGIDKHEWKIWDFYYIKNLLKSYFTIIFLVIVLILFYYHNQNVIKIFSC